MSQMQRLRRLDRKVRRRHRRQRLRLLRHLHDTVPITAELERSCYNRIARLADLLGVSRHQLAGDSIRAGLAALEREAREEEQEAPPASGPRARFQGG
jgi:uncharacterized tellurite resistance protein B-like protein